MCDERDGSRGTTRAAAVKGSGATVYVRCNTTRTCNHCQLLRRSCTHILTHVTAATEAASLKLNGVIVSARNLMDCYPKIARARATRAAHCCQVDTPRRNLVNRSFLPGHGNITRIIVICSIFQLYPARGFFRRYIPACRRCNIPLFHECFACSFRSGDQLRSPVEDILSGFLASTVYRLIRGFSYCPAVLAGTRRIMGAMFLFTLGLRDSDVIEWLL